MTIQTRAANVAAKSVIVRRKSVAKPRANAPQPEPDACDRIIEHDLAAGNFDHMSYAELEKYVDDLRLRFGRELNDDAWDLQMARDNRLGKLDKLKKMSDTALEDARSGKTWPLPE